MSDSNKSTERDFPRFIMVNPTDHPETVSERAWRRTKENPIVPIASVFALGAVYFGARRLLSRDSQGLQSAMRWRVGLQTLAFGAVFGAMAMESMRIRRDLERQMGGEIDRVQLVEKRLESVGETKKEEAQTIRKFWKAAPEIVCHEPVSGGLYPGICGYPKESHPFRHAFVPGEKPN